MQARFAAAIVMALGLPGCRSAPGSRPCREGSGAARHPAGPTDGDLLTGLATSSPAAEGVDPRRLLALTDWVRDHDVPIFSFLVSRHGRLVYELYTSGATRGDAHYVMSVTKSFVSALVGIAIDQRLLRGADEPVADALPPRLFASDADRERFRGVTLEQVLGMSALNAQVAPHSYTPEAVARLRAFSASPNRVRFALTQALLPAPGVSFQYTDVTPLLAVGAVEYAAGQSAFDFAQAHLFGPLGFRNVEWMHADASGGDNGAFGLRLRPVDMQKFGVLYLQGGAWNGRQIVSPEWVARSFTPWLRSRPELPAPDYGRFFWADRFGPWTARVANGWKGQRIAVVPAEGVVVTMTGAIEQGEDAVFRELMEAFVVPAVGEPMAPLPPLPELDAELRARLDAVRDVNRRRPSLEWRMVPGASAKERRRPFRPR